VQIPLESEKSSGKCNGVVSVESILESKRIEKRGATSKCCCLFL